MTFSEAFTLHGPDVERIARDIGITPPEADRLINEEMKRRHEGRRRPERLSYHRDYNFRSREDLREIRARRPA
jgi:hypothetical protein